MKKLTIFAFALLFSVQLIAQERLLVGGSGSGMVAIINRASGEIEWSYKTPEKSECNSVAYTKSGNVAFSYKQGAKCVTLDGDVIFDYKAGEGEEIQSISEIKGGFLLGVCGTPMRIVELNKKGEVTKNLTYDTGVEKAHSQMRQMRQSNKGGYLLPIIAKKKVVELNKKGEVIAETALENGAFSIVQDKKSGDCYAACGHSGYIYKIDGKSGELSTVSDKKALSESVNIEYGAEISLLKNGNLMMANWLGHKGDLTQPILIELTKSGEIVWTMHHPEEMKFVSAVCPIY
ncbi:MAG: hypothetical protein SNJ33_00360 [Rikenellaceae bacterium]